MTDPIPQTSPNGPTGGGELVDGEIDVYHTVEEGVKPYPAKIGDRVFWFTRKPNAYLQLKLAEIAREQAGPEHAGLIKDILSSMVQNVEDIDEILKQLDLNETARLMNTALQKMSDRKERPTTDASGSLPGAAQTTSGTGSSGPASDVPSSTT